MSVLQTWIREWADRDGFRPMIILWLGVIVTLTFFVISGLSVWEADLKMIHVEKLTTQFGNHISQLLICHEQRADMIMGTLCPETVSWDNTAVNAVRNIEASSLDARAVERVLHIRCDLDAIWTLHERMTQIEDSAADLVSNLDPDRARQIIVADEYAQLDHALRESVRSVRHVVNNQGDSANTAFNARLIWITVVGGIFFVALTLSWFALMQLMRRHLEGRRRTEEELRESEEKYRGLIDALPHGVMISQDGKFVFGNAASAAMFGFESADDIRNVNCLDVVCERDKTRAYELAMARARGEADIPLHHEFTFVRRNGEEFPAEVFIRPVLYHGRDAAQYVLMDITERRQAEEALRESEEKYRTLIDALPDAVAILQDGKVVFCNPAAVTTFGYQNSRGLIGCDRNSLLPVRERQNFERFAAGQTNDDNPVSESCSIYLLRCNQEEFPAQVFVRHVTYAGKPALQLVIHDVTEHERAEQALRESEERFRNLSDSAPVLIWMGGVNRHTYYFNKTWLRFTGRTVGQEYGHGWKQSVHPQDLPRCMAVYESAFGSRVPFTVEYRLRHADGTDHWVLDTGAPRFTADGNFAGFIGSCVDITTRRATEEALRESGRQFRDLADFLPHIIFETDERGMITFTNRKGFETFGFTPQDLEHGISVLDTLALQERERARENVARALRGEQNRNNEYLARRKDGTLFPVSVDSNLRDVDGKICGLRGMVIDITERKNTEEELRRLNRALKTTSECDQALVHAADEDSLLNDICRIVVNSGGYRMAWAGYVETENRTVVPAAHAGCEQGYLRTVKITWDDSDTGRGPTGMAIKTGKPSVNRDISGGAAYTPWRAEAVKRGYRSSISLPLMASGTCFGVLNIYSAMADAFDTMEVSLLAQLADDLAFGIQALRTGKERETTEAALRASEARFHALFDEASFGMGVAGLNRKILEANRTLLQMVGYPWEELKGMNFCDLTHPDDREIDVRLMEQLLAGERDHYVVEKRYVHKKGNVIFVRVTIFAIRDANGDVSCFVGAVEDVTEIKRVEAMLKDQTTAINTAIDGIAILDSEGRYIYVNEPHARVYGFENPAELIGRSWEILYDEAELRRFHEQVMPQLFRDGRWQGKATGRRQDGSKFLQELSLGSTESGGLVCVVRPVVVEDCGADGREWTVQAGTPAALQNVKDLVGIMTAQVDTLQDLQKPQNADEAALSPKREEISKHREE